MKCIKFKIKGINFSIPKPSKKDLMGYRIVGHRPAKKGEFVFSMVKGRILQKDHKTTTAYWVVKLK